MLPTRDYLNIPEQLSLHFPRKWRIGEGSTSFKSSMSAISPVILKALPSNSNLPASSCGNEPSKLNPCPTVCYLYVITKEQGKGTLALPKNLPRLLITSWQRKDVWKTLFQNKSSGTINPVYLPQTTPEQYKERVDQKKRCLSQILPNIFILELRRNIPLTTMTLIVFCLEIMQRKENASTLILWTWG